MPAALLPSWMLSARGRTVPACGQPLCSSPTDTSTQLCLPPPYTVNGAVGALAPAGGLPLHAQRPPHDRRPQRHAPREGAVVAAVAALGPQLDGAHRQLQGAVPKGRGEEVHFDMMSCNMTRLGEGWGWPSGHSPIAHAASRRVRATVEQYAVAYV